MNELKPEDVMISCDRAQPSDERSALREYRRRIYEAVNYRGDCDHEDVTTILLEYKKALLREKDAEIDRIRKAAIEVSMLLKDLKEHDLPLAFEEEKRNAITEFAEKAKRRLPIVSPVVFDQIVNELKGVPDNGR